MQICVEMLCETLWNLSGHLEWRARQCGVHYITIFRKKLKSFWRHRYQNSVCWLSTSKGKVTIQQNSILPKASNCFYGRNEIFFLPISIIYIFYWIVLLWHNSLIYSRNFGPYLIFKLNTLDFISDFQIEIFVYFSLRNLYIISGLLIITKKLLYTQTIKGNISVLA